MNVLEYICLDSENKFRSKTVFSSKSIEEIEEVLVESSMINNVVVESHDIVMVPVKCIPNPLLRDGKHWLVLCELRYPNGSIHKYNTRDALLNLIAEHADYEVALTQQFVLFNQDKKPMGWNDKIDLMKNYTSKLEYMQHSQKIIDLMIENLIYVGIDISNIQMERMVSRWSVTFQSKQVVDACDELFLFRYILQRLCSNNNVIVSFNPDPIKSSMIYSRCYLSLSSEKMRADDGLQELDRACKKLELKHLEQHKFLCEFNSKQFSYGQNSSRYDAVIHLNSNNGGYLEDKRVAADCDIYRIADRIVRTIETDYNIDTMSANLEQLKERFNYKNALNTGIVRPVITTTTTTSTPITAPVNSESIPTTATSKEKKKEKKVAGLSGLARILKLNEDSDAEENEDNTEKDSETKNMSRVEEIIHRIKNMNISHNILQSVTAPKSSASEIKHDTPPSHPDMSHLAMPINPNQGLGMLPSQPQLQPPIQGDPQSQMNGLQTPMMPMQSSLPMISATPVLPNSLYTLPSQI